MNVAMSAETYMRRLMTRCSALAAPLARSHASEENERYHESPQRVAGTSVLAVANAFAVLGLLSEESAEALMQEHKVALESMGVQRRGYDLDFGDASARGFWKARVGRRDGLSRMPLRAVPARLCLRIPTGDFYVDWLTQTTGGIRLRTRVVNADPSSGWPQDWASGVEIYDDHGRSYSLRGEGGVTTTRRSEPPFSSQGRFSHDRIPELQVFKGAETLVPNAGEVGWLEFRSTETGQTERVVLSAPVELPVGRADPPWPTPGETYLSWLIPERTYPSLGQDLDPEGAAEVIAAVAAGLLAVGALPPESELLRRVIDSGYRDWHDGVQQMWLAGVKDPDTGPMLGEHLSLVARLPFDNAVFVIEGINMADDVVELEFYGFPLKRGTYWPVAVRSFDIRATDDAGNQHITIERGGQGGSGCEWNGRCVLWPPVSNKAKRLKLTVSTCWEAAWAEIDLPGRA